MMERTVACPLYVPLLDHATLLDRKRTPTLGQHGSAHHLGRAFWLLLCDDAAQRERAVPGRRFDRLAMQHLS